VSLSVLEIDDARLDRLDATTHAPAWPNAAPRSRVEPATVEPPAVESLSHTVAPTTEAGQALGGALRRVADALIAESSRLNELDQAVGDGDIGVSLARGARAMLDAIPSLPLDDPAPSLHALSVLLQRSLGGTSGPLYAMALLRASSRLREDPTDWSGALSAGCLGISELGGAGAGDRTMLDALIPASEAFEAAIKAGNSNADALRQAIAAAQSGATSTASMSPRKGARATSAIAPSATPTQGPRRGGLASGCDSRIFGMKSSGSPSSSPNSDSDRL